MRNSLPLPLNLPPMSRQQQRAIKQQIREQIKPMSVALIDQAKTFYGVVGQGISHWSHMEERLIQVAARLLRTTEAKAGLVMYSIINFNVWLQIIDDLFVMDGTYPTSFKMWRRVLKALKKEKDIRDRLAHHALSQEREAYKHTKGIQAYLRPAKSDTRNKSKQMKPLTILEIVDFTGSVGDIHSMLILLLQQMKKPKSSR
jgi:hypothetical protein